MFIQSVSLTEYEVFRLPHNVTLSMTVSIGLAQYTGHPDPKKLLKRADDAMYLAKEQGRNRVTIAD